MKFIFLTLRMFFTYVKFLVSQKPLARCRQSNVTKLNSNFNAKMAIVCRLFLLPFVGLFFAKINHVSAKNAQKFVKMIAKPASKTANIQQKKDEIFLVLLHFLYCLFQSITCPRTRTFYLKILNFPLTTFASSLSIGGKTSPSVSN